MTSKASLFARCCLLVATFSASVSVFAAAQLVSEPGRRAVSPEIAVGPDGAINVIWLDKGLTADRPPPKPRKPGEHSHRSSTDLYFARSEDGVTWSKPVRVNDIDGEIWGFSVSKPRIGVGPTGTIHIFYPANDRVEAFDKDMVSARYRRSTDNGKSFSAPITINRPAGADREDVLGEGLAATNSFGTMGVAPDGTIITAWQNTDEMSGHADGADGVVAISTDDGKSFQPQQTVLPDNDICPCCQLTLTFDSKNTAYMGLRKIFVDGRDSAVARSTDGGKSFGVDGRLDFEHWDIDGCPLKPTELAVSGDNVYAAAYTGGEEPPGVYFSVSRDGGKTFSGKREVHPGASVADAPALTVDSLGNVRLVWHAKVDEGFRLYTAVSGDAGDTLSAPAEIAAPEGKAKNPATAVAPDGTVYVTWEHENEEVFVIPLPSPASAASR